MFVLLAAVLVANVQARAMPGPVLMWGDVLSPVNKSFDMDGGNFDILSKLVRFAGLATDLTTLKGFTLFAPNDAAFVLTARIITDFRGPITDEEAAFNALVAVVTKGIVVGNATVAGPELVKTILLYHVINARISSTVVLRGPLIIRTFNDLRIISTGKGELVDQSPDTPNPSVVKADIMLQNNVIVHVINAVLLPVPVAVNPSVIFCQ